MAILNIRKTKPVATYSFDIRDAVELEVGDYVVIDASGTVTTLSDTYGVLPLGHVMGFEDLDTPSGADTGSSGGSPVPEVGVDLEERIGRSMTVTGVTGIVDVGSPVYATGEQTYTLTETANIPAVGEVVRFVTGTSVDVLFYSHAQISAAFRGILQRRAVRLFTVHNTALEGTSAAVLGRFVSRAEGRIAALHVRPVGFDSLLTSGSQTLNLDIAGTNLSGGVITITGSLGDTITDLGTITDATTVTASNEFSEGQTISLELATGGTAMPVADTVSWEIWADIEYGGR